MNELLVAEQPEGGFGVQHGRLLSQNPTHVRQRLAAEFARPLDEHDGPGVGLSRASRTSTGSELCTTASIRCSAEDREAFADPTNAVRPATTTFACRFATECTSTPRRSRTSTTSGQACPARGARSLKSSTSTLPRRKGSNRLVSLPNQGGSHQVSGLNADA